MQLIETGNFITIECEKLGENTWQTIATLPKSIHEVYGLDEDVPYMLAEELNDQFITSRQIFQASALVSGNPQDFQSQIAIKTNYDLDAEEVKQFMQQYLDENYPDWDIHISQLKEVTDYAGFPVQEREMPITIEEANLILALAKENKIKAKVQKMGKALAWVYLAEETLKTTGEADDWYAANHLVRPVSPEKPTVTEEDKEVA